jgi:hypothetical protein
MRLFFSKTIGLSSFIVSLVLFGLVAPASAADPVPFLNPQISMSGTVPATGANTQPLVISVTTVTPGATSFQVQGFSWSLVTPIGSTPTPCPSGVVVTGMTAPLTCISFPTSGANHQVLKIDTQTVIPAGTTISVTTPAGFWNTATGASFAAASTVLSGNTTQILDDAFLSLDPPAPPAPPAPNPEPAANPTLAVTGGLSAENALHLGAIVLGSGFFLWAFAARRNRHSAQQNRSR